MTTELHIVALDVPSPPDYGGMIDTFYRIKSLNHIGIQIHLHCFEYGRPRSKELESVCKTVNYYKRRPGFSSHFTHLPYTVKSRSSDSLLKNLIKDDLPILFDGLFTTYYLGNPSLAGRLKFVRAHNIEHRYLSSLSKYERNLIKKIYFKIESARLKRYENILRKSEKILAISPGDFEYFQNRYNKTELLLPFHPGGKIESLQGSGDYCLFHSNLSISENSAIAEFLISKVFSKVPFQCILAGKNPSEHLIKKTSRYRNIKIISNPDNETIIGLIRNAHINILPVYAVNGLKLKLLISLCNGRHCIANERMIRSTWLEELCHIADTPAEMISKINSLMKQPFNAESISAREKIIFRYYDNYINANKLASILFPPDIKH
jgi:hypothetical protein